MADETKTTYVMDPFQKWSHRWGRLLCFVALVYMIALPIIVLSQYDALPAFFDSEEAVGLISASTISILLIYIPVGLSEAFSYTPILGSSAYVTFITGNIMNLKLPVAINAIKLAGVEQNTPEGDAVAAMAVSASSILTIIIIGCAAALASQISWIFEIEQVQTASNYIIPALFGSLTLGLFASSSSGSMKVVGGIKGMYPVLILVTIAAIVYRFVLGWGSLFGMVGYVILICLPIGLITSRILWKKGIIKVVPTDGSAEVAPAEEAPAEEAPAAE